MKRQRRYIVDILFVLTLFGLFAFSALLLVIIGANVYKNTVDLMSTNYDERTSVSYITEKVRHSKNNLPGVEIIEVNSTPVLLLNEEKGGEVYCTYLYCDGGYLKELFVKEDNSYIEDLFGAGEKIMPLSAISFSENEDGLLEVSVTSLENIEETFYVSTKIN